MKQLTLDHEVPDILCDPGNIGNVIFGFFLQSWKSWKSEVPNILLDPVNAAGRRAARPAVVYLNVSCGEFVPGIL